MDKSSTETKMVAGAEAYADVAKLDPLGVAKCVSGILPSTENKPIDLSAEAKKPEKGSQPLSNQRRERFCMVLVGFDGDGKRKRNGEAYEIVYGKKGTIARVNSSRLLAIEEVRDRVEYLESKMAEINRHDYRAAQVEIDELRLRIIDRAKKNLKLAPVALAAARDFEKAHGLDEAAKRTEIFDIQGAAVNHSSGGEDVLAGVRAVLARVVKRTE